MSNIDPMLVDFSEWYMDNEEMLYFRDNNEIAWEAWKAGRESMHKDVMEVLPKAVNENGENYINVYSAHEIHERLKELK